MRIFGKGPCIKDVQATRGVGVGGKWTKVDGGGGRSAPSGRPLFLCTLNFAGRVRADCLLQNYFSLLAGLVRSVHKKIINDKNDSKQTKLSQKFFLKFI